MYIEFIEFIEFMGSLGLLGLLSCQMNFIMGESRIQGIHSDREICANRVSNLDH